jgi:hypothetical protein
VGLAFRSQFFSKLRTINRWNHWLTVAVYAVDPQGTHDVASTMPMPLPKSMNTGEQVKPVLGLS